MYVDVAASGRSWRELYALYLGIVTPRPIALVSSVSAAGVHNLAPFSWYNLVSANPPVLMFVPGFKRDGTEKDTLINVRETKQFVVATVTEAIVEESVRAGAAAPAEVSEFDFAGLTPAPASKVAPPLVQESPVNIECTLRDIITINNEPGGGNVVFGDIVAIHVADWLLGEDGVIDSKKLRAVGRLGRSDYATVVEPYSLEIPEYK